MCKASTDTPDQSSPSQRWDSLASCLPSPRASGRVGRGITLASVGGADPTAAPERVNRQAKIIAGAAILDVDDSSVVSWHDVNSVRHAELDNEYAFKKL